MRIVLLFIAAGIWSCHTSEKHAAAIVPAGDTTSKPAAMDAGSSALLRIKEKLDAGIDFTASGNEPFWSLEMDLDKQMHFKNVSGVDFIAPVSEPAKAADAAVTRYRAVTEKGELIVQLAKRSCINDMNGDTSNYTVTVDTKLAADNAYTTYKGCGNFTFDYRINDIWVLEQINGAALKKDGLTKGAPQLEINLAQQKLFGHTGCNNLNGAAEVQGKKISFGMFAATRMACPAMDFENNYIKQLQRKTIPYKIESGKLQLQISADTLYTYRKVD